MSKTKLQDYYCPRCGWKYELTDKPLDGAECPNECGAYIEVSENGFLGLTDREWHIRNTIIKFNIKHCKSLTPEQVRSVLSIVDSYDMNIYLDGRTVDKE